MKKELGVALIILALIVGFVVGMGFGKPVAPAPQQNQTAEVKTAPVKDIAILLTSDIQSQLFPYDTKKKIMVNGEKVKVAVTTGGFTRIASLVKGIKAVSDGTLVVDTGDLFAGPVFATFHGIPEVEAMNAIGYDVLAPGNHEFDQGIDTMVNALKNAKFAVLIANVKTDNEGLKNIIKPYIVKDIAGIKVGIFGLITPDLPRITNVGTAVTVEDPIAVAKEMVKKLRNEEKVDIVIAATHIGTPLDEKLAEEVPGIDIILGGHTHDVLYEKKGNTIIAHAGAKGEVLGYLNIKVQNGKIIDSKWSPIFMGEDPQVENLLDTYKAKLEEIYSATIGYTKVDLDARKEVVRTKESNLGNLITDSWMERFPEADLAITNGGGIRGDRIYPAGVITYQTLINIHPFGNTVVMVKVNGKELKQIFEIAGSALRVKGDGCEDANRAPTGGFLQVSGVKVTYDLSKAPFCAEYDGREVKKVINPGERVKELLVYDKKTGKYEPVQDDKTYTVLINSWMAGGGDGYYIFMNKDKVDTNQTIPDVLMYYIKKHSPIAPKVEGRITEVGGTPQWED
jgi:5'-nucleotidase